MASSQDEQPPPQKLQQPERQEQPDQMDTEEGGGGGGAGRKGRGSQQHEGRGRGSTADDDGDGGPPESPPLPTRHTAATPGPRAARLRDLYASSLAHTLDKIGWDNFAACYPNVAAGAGAPTLRKVQKQMVDRLEELCNREFEAVMQNRNVVAKLNELESLVSDAARRKDEAAKKAKKSGSKEAVQPPTPPHLLPADRVLAAHLAPVLAQQQSQLNARLQNTQAENAVLSREISAQHAEAERLLATLEAAVADVDGASRLLDEVAEDLAAETRTVEIEMAGTR